MAASDHVNPHQLSLFMPAKNLMEVPSGDTGVYKSLSESIGVFVDKLAESKAGHWEHARTPLNLSAERPDTLFESIEKKGVQDPVSIRFSPNNEGKATIIDGNHRIASAYVVDPNMEIPVRYDD